MLLPLVVACAGGSDTIKAPEDTKAPDGTQSPADTTDPNLDGNGYLKDSLPEDLRFDGTTLIIQYWGSEIVKNYDTESVGENNGVDLDAEVYKRNLAVAERLGVAFEFVAGETTWKKHSALYRITLPHFGQYL